MAASPVTGQNVNYAITPDFPPPPRPEPFVVTTIPLPPNVTDAILVNYLADGEHLVMEVQIAGRSRADIATMKEDGSDFRCLTDGVKGDIGGEMPVPLPDGKRVYTPTGILECSPSILDCKEARILPLVYPKIKGATSIARIATNMSPDGIHVAYTLITTRPQPLVLVSELTRISDEKGERFELSHTKVIAGDKPTDGDSANIRPNFWGNGEVKSFTGQGRFLATISAFEMGNFDVAQIDLTTGEVSRFTRHFSYDEGVYPSPDGEWVIVQSHRHTTRMDAFGLIPRPLVAGGGSVAEHRNEIIQPAQPARRFYGLTLLDKFGDRARLPEDGYTGQNLLVAKDNLTEYNHFGNFTWHPSSTRGVFWEQKDHLKVKSGEANGRLRLIKFTARKPTTPMVPLNPEMKWARNLEDIEPMVEPIPREGKLAGAVSGYANVSVQKPGADNKELLVKIQYVNFSDDGASILNGIETELRTSALNMFDRKEIWNADIVVTGKRKGFLKAENAKLTVAGTGAGIIRTELGDRKVEVDLARGLPTGVPDELK